MSPINWYGVAMTQGSSNMFEEDKEEKKGEALDSVGDILIADSMGKVMGAIGSPIGFLKSIGIMAKDTPYDVGQASFKAEFQHTIDEWAAPWTSYWGNYRADLERLYGSWYYENRAGGYIGRQVGGAIGWVIGLWFPALQPLFTELFGELGGLIGTLLSGWADANVVHPDVPGSPGEISPPEGPYVPPYHDPAWFEGTVPDPYVPPPASLVRHDVPSGMHGYLAKRWHYM